MVVGLWRVSGPHAHTPLPNLKFPPLGGLPKKTPGKFSLILPPVIPPWWLAINQAIFTVKYAYFDTTVDVTSAALGQPSHWQQQVCRPRTYAP